MSAARARSELTNLYDLSKDQLTGLIGRWGEPRYRADQVWTWLYRHKVGDFDAMGNIPAGLRERLAVETRIGGMESVGEQHSSDGETRKYLLRLPDRQLIEAVLMQYAGVRRTACISTQAGCAMGCVFCATGQMGLARHLTSGEIVEQALHVARILEGDGERLSNVVLMGMGEPFHNYDATLEAIRRLMDEEGLNIGQRHITVSTVGLIPEMRRFAEEGLQVRLAISLHAATDKERSALLPINKRYPIGEVLEAARYYVERTGRRVTFEWALIEGENDTAEQAHALGKLLDGLLCHVNVIPLNPTEGYAGQKPDRERVDRFAGILAEYGVTVTVRVRRGIDIQAGCGQLKTAVVRGEGRCTT
jgi:23S rRNA (adenine2503-C2)-methyltransferase